MQKIDIGRVSAVKKWAEDQLELIMRFWGSDLLLDKENGGFVGRIDQNMTVAEGEPKALVVSGRMLYAFCKAYELTGSPLYKDRADRMYRYLTDHFYDREYGGAYNLVTADGAPRDDVKRTYAESFFLMGLAAYVKAFKDADALKLARETFDLYESKLRHKNGSYEMGFDRTWEKPIDYSAGHGAFSIPEGAHMFQHHLCQSYQLLFEGTGDPAVLEALENMTRYSTDIMYDPKTRSYKTLIGSDGSQMEHRHNFGHDCEIAYMVSDLAAYTGKQELMNKADKCGLASMDAVLETAWGKNGNFLAAYNFDTGEIDSLTSWWAQAEGIIGMFYAYELTGDAKYIAACEKAMACADKYFADAENGDWLNHMEIREDGSFRLVEGQHGFDRLNGGKCPYHNVKMCAELILRAEKLLADK